MLYRELIRARVMYDFNMLDQRHRLQLRGHGLDFINPNNRNSPEFQMELAYREDQLIDHFMRDEFGTGNRHIWTRVLDREVTPAPVSIDWDRLYESAMRTGTGIYTAHQAITGDITVTGATEATNFLNDYTNNLPHPDVPEARELPEEQTRWATEMLGRIPF